jgi:hypothetical protein
MKIKTSIIIMAISAITQGCLQNEQKESKNISPEKLIEGVKYSQLASPDIQKLPGATSFKVFTFLIPASQNEVIDSIFRELSVTPLRFANSKSFLANGFLAGFGYEKNWPTTAAILKKANAIRKSSTTILNFDQEKSFVKIKKLEGQQSIFYTDSQGSLTGKELQNGSAAIVIEARTNKRLIETAELNLSPAFLPPETNKIRINNLSSETYFKSSALSCRISPGQFILLGPTHYSPDKFTLNNLFFSTTKKDIEMIRLLLVVCMQVKQ